MEIAILLLMTVYIAILVYCVRLGRSYDLSDKASYKQSLIYALAIGVYCTSWTYNGLVDLIVHGETSFFTVLLGPLFLFTIGSPVLKRVAEITHRENLHSISDFLTSRYGKRQAIGTISTIILIIATVPYIALQLKALTASFVIVTGSSLENSLAITLFFSVIMALFSLLLTSKHNNRVRFNNGMSLAISFESVIKLASIVIVAGFSIYLIDNISIQDVIYETKIATKKSIITIPNITELIVSTLIIFCLPRMFHVCFVEYRNPNNLTTARWIFPLYLMTFLACIFIIGIAARIVLTDTSFGQLFIYQLPLSKGAFFITCITFLGSFSAATAMIIVSTVTLSRILASDIIMPLIIRYRSDQNKHKDYTELLLNVRRATITLVIVSAFFYAITLTNQTSLSDIGLMAFALAVQLAPAVILGSYWRWINANGVIVGLISGFFLWFYTLIIPILSEERIISNHIVEVGLFSLQWLKPEHLFNSDFGDAYSRSVIFSLSCNLILMLIVSKISKNTVSDRIQAIHFVKHNGHPEKLNSEAITSITASELNTLLVQFLGQETSNKIIASSNSKINQQQLINAENALANVLGVATASSLIDDFFKGNNKVVEEVIELIEGSTKALRFNQDILLSAIDTIPIGISVINQDLELVAWNNRYEAMFNYPKNYLQIGLPISDIVRFNAKRGLLGAKSAEYYVNRRTTELLKSTSYVAVREHSKNITIEIKGQPLSNGGYVTTYSDISSYQQAQSQLQESRDKLEQRVLQRTQKIEDVNRALTHEIALREKAEAKLILAKSQAESANINKSELLALAAHDILQPLNAANLFANALESNIEERHKGQLISLKNSIESAESIISTLLEIAKLDTGALQPNFTSFSINNVLEPLITQYQAVAPEGVKINYKGSNKLIYSDRGYLRRILQNLISNAIKYCDSGRVLVGVRVRKEYINIGIYDTGIGIPNSEIDRIFNDFYRSSRHQHIEGIGLGLAVTRRLSDLLNLNISVKSKLHSGTCFSLNVPLSTEVATVNTNEKSSIDIESQLDGVNVFCVDDDQQNLDGLYQLLANWGCHVACERLASSALKYALHQTKPDIILMDYQLDYQNENGIDLAKKLIQQWGQDIPVCIVSASPMEELRPMAIEAGFSFIKKPIKPAKLKALIRQKVGL